MSWIVELIQPPPVNTFGSNYFPRKFHYKSDAEKLRQEIEQNGGKAIITVQYSKDQFKYCHEF